MEINWNKVQTLAERLILADLFEEQDLLSDAKVLRGGNPVLIHKKQILDYKIVRQFARPGMSWTGYQLIFWRYVMFNLTTRYHPEIQNLCFRLWHNYRQMAGSNPAKIYVLSNADMEVMQSCGVDLD